MPRPAPDRERADDEERAAPADVVRDTLLEYAERGVFRGFDYRKGGEGTTDFRFVWLADRPFHVVFDEKSCTLTFERLLPGAGEDSEVRADLEELVRERQKGDVPEHRRVDPDRATVELVSQEGGDAALVLRVRNEDFEYGVRRILNLVNEIWVRLNYAHQRYLWDEFDAPME